MSFDREVNRRRFLQYLAASPLFAYGGNAGFAADAPMPGTRLSDPLTWAPMKSGESTSRRP